MSYQISPESRALFPLEKISDLETLFKLECIQKSEPNLAFWSIILGAVEHSLVHLDYSVQTLLPVGVSVGGSAGVAVENVEQEKPRLISPPSVTGVSKTAAKRKSKGRRRNSGLKNKVAVDFKQAKNVIEQIGNDLISEKKDNNDKTGEEENIIKISEGDGKVNGHHQEEEEKEIINRNEKETDFPPIHWEDVEVMYLKFKSMVTSLVDLTEYTSIDNKEESTSQSQGTSNELVKRVSDVVWSFLSRSYKSDIPHIQSLYTYILGKKLDSFGVAVAVAAGCQLLGLNDVHLALSEDHAWVFFGPDGQQTAEVTWHGKGIEDKRGQPVRLGEDENSWLYLKGNAVNCSRKMEIASLVASINFSINSTLNSAELIEIQQYLLWQLYDAGHLSKYPMALSCLAEIEEIKPIRNQSASLFQEAITSSRGYYNDMHIYPYTMYAGYLSRQNEHKPALKNWANAARVIQKYGRTKNDDDIYREFLEISTDSLVNIMKNSSIGFSANSIVRDPISFANLMTFFDGICMWEEYSKTPIVHITWAKAWILAIGKFDYTIRRMVQISLGDSVGDEKENSKIPVGQRPGDDHEKDSGIDEDEMPFPKVTLFSQKMQQLKDLVKKDKMSSAVTLLLTAQSAIGSNTNDSHGKTSSEESGSVTSGRPRRERLSQNLDSPTKTKVSPAEKSPPRKRARLESGNPLV